MIGNYLIHAMNAQSTSAIRNVFQQKALKTTKAHYPLRFRLRLITCSSMTVQRDMFHQLSTSARFHSTAVCDYAVITPLDNHLSPILASDCKKSSLKEACWESRMYSWDVDNNNPNNRVSQKPTSPFIAANDLRQCSTGSSFPRHFARK